MVKRHVDQQIRTRNFEARNERMKTGVWVQIHSKREEYQR